MSWWDQFFRRRHLESDLSEELREHIEEKTEQLMRLENLSRAEARQAALVAFGNPCSCGAAQPRSVAMANTRISARRPQACFAPLT